MACTEHMPPRWGLRRFCFGSTCYRHVALLSWQWRAPATVTDELDGNLVRFRNGRARSPSGPHEVFAQESGRLGEPSLPQNLRAGNPVESLPICTETAINPGSDGARRGVTAAGQIGPGGLGESVLVLNVIEHAGLAGPGERQTVAGAAGG